MPLPNPFPQNMVDEARHEFGGVEDADEVKRAAQRVRERIAQQTALDAVHRERGHEAQRRKHRDANGES